MIYLTKEDWSNLILSKLNNEQLFKQEFLELYKIYNIIHLFCRKIYNKPNEQQIILIATQIIFHKYRIVSNFSLKEYSSEELNSKSDSSENYDSHEMFENLQAKELQDFWDDSVDDDDESARRTTDLHLRTSEETD